jgi:hypothetical protein
MARGEGYRGNVLRPVDLGVPGESTQEMFMGELAKFGEKSFQTHKDSIKDAAIKDANEQVLERDPVTKKLVAPERARESELKSITGWNSVYKDTFQNAVIEKYVSGSKSEMSFGIKEAAIEFPDDPEAFAEAAGSVLQGTIDGTPEELKQEFMEYGTKIYNNQLLSVKEAIAKKEVKQLIADSKIQSDKQKEIYYQSKRDGDDPDTEKLLFDAAVDQIKSQPNLSEGEKTQEIANLKYNGDIQALSVEIQEGMADGSLTEADALSIISGVKTPTDVEGSTKKEAKVFLKNTVTSSKLLRERNKDDANVLLNDLHGEELRNSIITDSYRKAFIEINGMEAFIKRENTMNRQAYLEQSHRITIANNIVKGGFTTPEQLADAVTWFPEMTARSEQEEIIFKNIKNYKKSDIQEMAIKGDINKPVAEELIELESTKEDEGKEYLNDPVQQNTENQIHNMGVLSVLAVPQDEPIWDAYANAVLSKDLIMKLRTDRETFQSNPSNEGKEFDIEGWRDKNLNPFLEESKKRDQWWITNKWDELWGQDKVNVQPTVKQGELKVGDIEDGYKYLGGDKSLESNWEKID